MTQPNETYADTDNHGAGVPTGRTVIAFGRMLELDQTARESALATLSEYDPELARQLASLLPNADRPTLVFTDFAAVASTGHAPHPLLVAGSAIGGFELLEQIGSGGMGEVWRARQTNPTREVALKVARLDAHAATRSAAIREPEALAALRHSCIATIHASGTDRGFAWIAMELIDGAQSLVDAARSLPLRARIALLADVADAIAHAHAAGFIHRDLKPSNILVDAAGRAKVIDFGIALPSAGARIADPVAWCGTPAYLAPEALDRDPLLVDARADIYALGVVLYEIAFGALPAGLSQRNPIALLRALATVNFAPPANAPRETRGDLAAIIAKATAREPEQRYRTVAALSDDLRALLARRPVTAAPRGTIGRVRLAARRNPIAALATAITALALVATTGVSIYAAIYAQTAAIEAGAVAEQTSAVYDAFLDTFLPQQLDPKSMRDLTVREYFRTRIEELERVATRPLGENSAKGCIETARMLQYSCISLDLLEEAERCNLLLQACSKRLSLKGKFSGMGVKETDLDAIYIRLARNPNDAPALAELRSLTPKFLEQNRIVRWTSLSRLGAVTYLHSVPLATAVASNLLDLRADDPDISVSACSLIALAMHSESARVEPTQRIDPAPLVIVRDVLRRMAQSNDPAARAEAHVLANGIDSLFSFDLIVAKHPELIEVLIDIAMIVDSENPSGPSLNYFGTIPSRLARIGAWETCAIALAAIDARLDRHSFRHSCFLTEARVALLLHHHGVDQGDQGGDHPGDHPGEQARADACAVYDKLLCSPPDEIRTLSCSDDYYDATIARGELIARLGDHARFQSAIADADQGLIRCKASSDDSVVISRFADALEQLRRIETMTWPAVR